MPRHLVISTHRGNGVGIFQNRQRQIFAVVGRIGTAFEETCHLIRHAEETDEIIQIMTPQIIHDPAIEAGKIPLIYFPAVIVDHIRLNFGNIAQPALLNRIPDKEHGWIVAVHVADLKGQIFCFAAVQQFFVEGKVFPGGFIHVHGQPPFHTFHGHGDQFIVGDFHGHGFNGLIFQNLFQRQFGVAFRRIIFRRENGGVNHLPVIHKAHDFKHILQTGQRGELADGVFVGHADLSDPDFFHYCKPFAAI